MQYKYEVKTFGDPKYYSNSVVFATEGEAYDAAEAKRAAWTQAEDTRVVTTEDEANYQFINGRLKQIEAPSCRDTRQYYVTITIVTDDETDSATLEEDLVEAITESCGYEILEGEITVTEDEA